MNDIRFTDDGKLQVRAYSKILDSNPEYPGDYYILQAEDNGRWDDPPDDVGSVWVTFKLIKAEVRLG